MIIILPTTLKMVIVLVGKESIDEDVSLLHSCVQIKTPKWAALFFSFCPVNSLNF